MPIATVNPTTGRTERTFTPDDESRVETCLAAAANAAAEYRHTTFSERAQWMRGAAELLEGELPVIASVLTTEMGKTFASAKGEVAKCARGMRWFAEHAEALLADESVETDARHSGVRFPPLGTVLAVMPWNFPLWQVVRFAAPALMAGNTGLLKHASNVPQTALLLEDLFRRAGFPAGVFQTLLVGAERVESLIEDPRVQAVTFTGSNTAGAAVARAAGRALKKTVLELGGSDPFIVLPSADLDRAISVGVEARVQNNGQSCIAAKRFIVHDALYEEFTSRFVAAMAALAVGDPFDPATEVGPLAVESGRDELSAQVRGAVLRCGGEQPPGPGFFYLPTVLTDVTEEMRVAREEVFGPVAVVFRARHTRDALRIANATPFGLGASVWTTDTAEQEECIDGLEAGLVFVNAMVSSVPELPFGGIKHSGYGRELAGQGIREFCNTKSVWIA